MSVNPEVLQQLTAQAIFNGNRNHDGGKDGETGNPIEVWRNAKAEYISYPKGRFYYGDGTFYDYDAGTRLIIMGNQVMDTCETPWCSDTVSLAFDQLIRDRKAPVRVLELGFGIGITGNRVIQKLVGRGRGEYRVVELNKDVYERSEKWKERWEKSFTGTSHEVPGTKPIIKIVLYNGEAGEVAKSLAERRKKFDIIISDTFPLRPEDRGINDLLYLPTLSEMLLPDGIFAFYPNVPGAEIGSEGQMIAQQYELLNPYFDEIMLRKSRLKTAPDYKYLWGKSGPLTMIPVAICKGLKV
ncbi:MAG: hypothetical protein M1268_04370 [Patescibacteria group bacterium]|nr:hypothetical protein [Patescibacteria group bacterium]